MKSRGWVTREGMTGEMPIRIVGTKHAAFVSAFAPDVEIRSYSSPAGTTLLPGDVCIVVGEVTNVAADTDPVEIEIDVLAVDTWVHRTERESPSDSTANEDHSTSTRDEQSSTPKDSEGIVEMMAHLEDAKEHQRERLEEERCANCRTIDSDTALSIETDVASRRPALLCKL